MSQARTSVAEPRMRPESSKAPAKRTRPCARLPSLRGPGCAPEPGDRGDAGRPCGPGPDPRLSGGTAAVPAQQREGGKAQAGLATRWTSASLGSSVACRPSRPEESPVVRGREAQRCPASGQEEAREEPKGASGAGGSGQASGRVRPLRRQERLSVHRGVRGPAQNGPRAAGGRRKADLAELPESHGEDSAPGTRPGRAAAGATGDPPPSRVRTRQEGAMSAA